MTRPATKTTTTARKSYPAASIKEQQEILNLNADRFISESQLTSFEEMFAASDFGTAQPNRPRMTQDACVQTSTTIFSDYSAASATTPTNETMMHTNTFGSIVANLGSASTRPSSAAIHAPSDNGMFEINRALLRHRAFSDGNGLSTRGVANSSIPHSISSSKLWYKRF